MAICVSLRQISGGEFSDVPVEPRSAVPKWECGGLAGLPSPVSGVRPVVSQPNHGLQRSPKIRPERRCRTRGLALSRLFSSSDVTSQSTLAPRPCTSNRNKAETGIAVTPTKQTTVVLSNRNKKTPPRGVANLQTEPLSGLRAATSSNSFASFASFTSPASPASLPLAIRRGSSSRACRGARLLASTTRACVAGQAEGSMCPISQQLGGQCTVLNRHPRPVPLWLSLVAFEPIPGGGPRMGWLLGIWLFFNDFCVTTSRQSSRPSPRLERRGKQMAPVARPVCP